PRLAGRRGDHGSSRRRRADLTDVVVNADLVERFRGRAWPSDLDPQRRSGTVTAPGVTSTTYRSGLLDELSGWLGGSSGKTASEVPISGQGPVCSGLQA